MSAKKSETYTAETMQRLRNDASAVSRTVLRPAGFEKPAHLDQKIRDEEARKRQIENDIAEADQRLKIKTLFILFIFLSIETLVIFVLAFLQGLHTFGFHMEEWSFRVVISATIGQITAMLTIAVQSLFPKKER